MGAQATAEQIALCCVQIRAIEADPKFRGGDYYDAEPGDGPHVGLSIARGIGQVSYRSELELDERFGRGHQDDEHPLDGGRYAVESYLEYHGEKLAGRFDANTYIVLSRGDEPPRRRPRARRDRAPRWRASPPTVTIAGISSDRLYPLRLQHELAELIPTRDGVTVIESIAGHDGFLVEARSRRQDHQQRAGRRVATRSDSRDDPRLTESYWPATDDDVVLDLTVGGMLRRAAAEHPTRTALVEGTASPECRRWTYAELLADAEQGRRGAARRASSPASGWRCGRRTSPNG